MNGVPDVILLVIDHRGDGISTAAVMIEETPRKRIVSSVDRVGSDYEIETRDEKANEKKVSQEEVYESLQHALETLGPVHEREKAMENVSEAVHMRSCA